MKTKRTKAPYISRVLGLTTLLTWTIIGSAAEREIYFFEVGYNYCLELESQDRRFALRKDAKYPAEMKGRRSGKDYAMTFDLKNKRARYFTAGAWKTTKLSTKRYPFRSDTEGNFDLSIDGCDILIGWKVIDGDGEGENRSNNAIDESIYAAQGYEEAIKNLEGILTPDEPTRLVAEWESDPPELLSENKNVTNLNTAAAAKQNHRNEPPVDNIKLTFYDLGAEQRKIIQSELKSLGFYRSSIDGMYGPGTRGAIEMYLASIDFNSEGYDQLRNQLRTLLIQAQERLAESTNIAQSDQPSGANDSSPKAGFIFGGLEESLSAKGRGKPGYGAEKESAASTSLLETPAVQSEGFAVEDEFLLVDLEKFVTAYPGSLESLKLASLYLPAKREADRGERGTKFDSLKAFVLENTDFVAYAAEQSNIRALEQQQKVQKQLSYINEQLTKLQAEIAAAPLSERALSLYTVIDKYQSINGSLEEQRILAAASALRDDLAVLDKAIENESQLSSDAAKPKVDSASELNKPTVAVELASCDTDPALCSFGELCKRSISFVTGRLDWDSRAQAAPYVEFAQSIGLKCGIQNASTLAQAEKTVTPVSKVPSKRADKYLKRKALVIGNANYLDQVPLKNPINDARAVSEKLREVGFEVTYRENLTVREFGRTLSDFEAELAGTDMSLLYYAGHGIEVEKQNYLIPVDAKLRSTRDVRYEAVRLDDAVDVAMNTGKLSMVLIDACRNNPFAGQMSDKNRSVGRGLSVTEVSTGPVYQILSFAAASGQVADDGDGANSPYASVLVELLDEPNLEVGKMFRLLGDRVSELTNGRQQPTKRDNLRGEDLYLVRFTSE